MKIIHRYPLNVHRHYLICFGICLWWVGPGWMPTKAALSLLSSARQGKENITEGSSGQEHSSIAVMGKMTQLEEKKIITNQIRVGKWELKPNLKTTCPLPHPFSHFHRAVVSPSHSVSVASSSLGKQPLTVLSCTHEESSHTRQSCTK